MSRTKDRELMERLWPSAEAALDWIDRYGDCDGDGFVEYRWRAANGLDNQGWKDSWDSVASADKDRWPKVRSLFARFRATYTTRS